MKICVLIYEVAHLGELGILKIQLLKVNQNIVVIREKYPPRKERGIINRLSGEEAVSGKEKNTFCLPDVRVSVIEVDGKVPQL